METSTIKSFQSFIRNFYTRNKRELPWRDINNPYKVWVSEIMLQQTQIARVLPKYELFIRKFPTISELAKATPADILPLWQGLGYNRRALAMLATANSIITNHNSEFPNNLEELQELPGIGPYTASAIRTFAYNSPEIFIETNIRTVFLYHFFFGESDISDLQILSLVELSLDQDNPRDWYYALMDYGAYIKSTLGNQNKRSKHYSKQSKFEGSKRQLRGEILRLLSEKNSLLIKDVYTVSKRTKKETAEIIADLMKEGFIEEIEGKFYLVKS